MAIMVNIHEAKTHFSRLLEQAHAGQEIILSKAGKPYARMVPLGQPEKSKRMPGRLAGYIDEAFFEPLPESELDAWEKLEAVARYHEPTWFGREIFWWDVLIQDHPGGGPDPDGGPKSHQLLTVPRDVARANILRSRPAMA